MFRAIQMRTEAHAFVRDFAERGKTEDLEAARIGEKGARPGHELVEPAQLANEFVAGAQIQMIGVGQEDFGAELLESVLREGLDGRRRSHGHEERRLHGTVRRMQHTATRAGRIGLRYLKGKIHFLSVSGGVSGKDIRPAGAHDGEGRPQAKRDHVGLAALELFRIRRGEADSEENERPEREDVKRLA